MNSIKTSAVILLSETETEGKYLFGAYNEEGVAVSFLSLPEDHGVFVKLLIGQQTIMGANTLKATPENFPDGGRICVTHHPENVKPPAMAVKNIEEAVQLAKERAKRAGEESVYVIGGASLIGQCLEESILDEIELTLVYGHKKEVQHPVYLDFDFKKWEILKDSGLLTSEVSEPKGLEYRFLTLKNRR